MFMNKHRPRPQYLGLLLALAGGVAAPPRAHAAAPSAREIMEKVTVTRKLDGSEAVVKMTVVDDKKQTRERDITMATKLYDGGKTEKRIYRFLSPADVQGTSILVFDYESKADDVWIYLPAMRKTRRIVSSQNSQSFMGSEFTYGDLNIPALDDFTYAIAKEESCGPGSGNGNAGDACWVIDVLPKNKETAESDGYSKKTFWVSKEKMAVVRGLFYDKDGKLLKELVAGDIKLLDAKNKRYRATHLEMTNKQNGRKAIFDTKKVTFAPNTKDEYFTIAYLERS